MKVLHVINTLSVGGAERQLLTLCRELARRDVEQVVACLRQTVPGSRSLRPEFEQVARVIDLRAERKLAWQFLATARSVVERERPDILHTHLPRADIGALFWRRAGGGVPWVCTVHDIHSASWSMSWALPAVARLWRKADGLIAISQAVQTWLTEACGVPARQITVIPYGIEADAFAAFRAAGGRRSPTGAVIGSIGRLEARKGHETLIRAMPDVLSRHPDAVLRIAGHDHAHHRAALEALVRGLGLDAQVTLEGFQEDVPAFLAGVDVFALASRAEGFGRAVIEAMAAGKPAVVNRRPPLDEVVVDCETGLTVTPDDPAAFAAGICYILDRPDEAARMGEAGRRRALEEYSGSAMAERTLAVYARVRAARRGAAARRD